MRRVAGEVKGRRQACRGAHRGEEATYPASRVAALCPVAAATTETDRRPVCRAVRLPPTARQENTSVRLCEAGRGRNLISDLRLGTAKLIERCSDGVGDQGAEDALWAQEMFRQFWKQSPARVALLSARLRKLFDRVGSLLVSRRIWHIPYLYVAGTDPQRPPCRVRTVGEAATSRRRRLHRHGAAETGPPASRGVCGGEAVTGRPPPPSLAPPPPPSRCRLCLSRSSS